MPVHTHTHTHKHTRTHTHTQTRTPVQQWRRWPAGCCGPRWPLCSASLKVSFSSLAKTHWHTLSNLATASKSDISFKFRQREEKEKELQMESESWNSTTLFFSSQVFCRFYFVACVAERRLYSHQSGMCWNRFELYVLERRLWLFYLQWNVCNVKWAISLSTLTFVKNDHIFLLYQDNSPVAWGWFITSVK